VLLLSVACQSNEHAVQQQAAALEREQGIVLNKGTRGAKQGESCHQDQECLQPLRCVALQCTLPPVVDGVAHDLCGRIRFENGGELNVEMALTPFQRERGLMFITRMAPDWGMLFVFDEQAQRSFWMQNTFISLDMVFLSELREVLNVVENAAPLEVGPRYRSKGPARFVLELNAGKAKELRIEAGQHIEFLSAPGAM
jgi:uncharacterized membrane protein (UPF0127 family)